MLQYHSTGLLPSTFLFSSFRYFGTVADHEVTEELAGKEDVDADEAMSQSDDHTFVALIDIVFTDGSKKTCTGAIIHDNVVITAAHCFNHEFQDTIKPELTASFVVIGTKKMFDSGYEQYLPIERIVTHPRFKGWTADLSLIYTFAAMTSDKPGKVIPLAGEKMSNPVDSNVTVFSWGRCNEHGEENPRVTVGVNSKRSRGEFKNIYNGFQLEKQIPLKEEKREEPKKFVVQQSRFRKESRKDDVHQYPSRQQKIMDKLKDDIPATDTNNSPISKHLSRYLTSSEDNKEVSGGRRGRIFKRSPSERSLDSNNNMNIYKNWRRNMGKTVNKLTVEVFGFVNLAACKKIVEGSNTAPHYDFKNGEVACYTSDEHFITEEDSGAPAIRHGHLVAVTVGGAECDGDHVGVGMKMSCYCTWIADNLP
ncbi:hypothetical protein ABMA28_001481 [Loxostege sticticalis]|uniref:Peptidase S1 domain-containing protein n=1 Tax=Loxostege sticticalis TaxID=481309 RepID=A0ABD0T1U2_LOXSC